MSAEDFAGTVHDSLDAGDGLGVQRAGENTDEATKVVALTFVEEVDLDRFSGGSCCCFGLCGGVAHGREGEEGEEREEELEEIHCVVCYEATDLLAGGFVSRGFREVVCLVSGFSGIEADLYRPGQTINIGNNITMARGMRGLRMPLV